MVYLSLYLVIDSEGETHASCDIGRNEALAGCR